MKHPADKLRAWLLHSRPFRETSLLLDFFSLERGRFSAIARGVRSARGNRRALLQPFTPLSVSVTGRTELLTLKEVETAGPALSLTGDNLFSALYVNELVVRLLTGHEAEPELFHYYEGTLDHLRTGHDVEVALRCFELQLLDSLGYGIDLGHDAEHGAPVVADARYYLHPHSGLVRAHGDIDGSGESGQALFAGADLLAIQQRDFSAGSTRQAAKHLMRHLLRHHLGDRELASRALFRRAR